MEHVLYRILILLLVQHLFLIYFYPVLYFQIAGCCYSMILKNSHPCVEGAMHHDCPVCFEVSLSFRALSHGKRKKLPPNLLNRISHFPWFNDDIYMVHSICLNRQMMSVSCHVATPFMFTVWRKCSSTSSMFNIPRFLYFPMLFLEFFTLYNLR